MTTSRTHIIRSLLMIGMMAGSFQILSAQKSLPYHVDFANGIPADWMQSPSDTIFWEFTPDVGDMALGAGIVDLGYTHLPGSSGIETPALDLSSVPNPTLRFKLAVILKNFVGPALALWYDDGTGPQLLDTWGQSRLSNFVDKVNHIIPASSDNVLPLDVDRIIWNEITVDLSSLAGEENITFMFRAEFPNGGWVVLDDVVFANGTVTSVESVVKNSSLTLYPNPTYSTLMIESEDAVHRVEVINALGRVVLVSELESSTKQTIDVAGLAAGTYWVRMIGAQGAVLTESFMKMDGE